MLASVMSKSQNVDSMQSSRGITGKLLVGMNCALGEVVGRKRERGRGGGRKAERKAEGRKEKKEEKEEKKCEIVHLDLAIV